MRKGQFTVIIARASAASRKYALSQEFVVTSAVIALILASSMVFFSLHYYHMTKQMAQHSRIKGEADQLRMENERFRVVAKQLTEKIAALEVTSKKLKIFSGLDREGLGGVGGPSTADAPFFGLSSRDIFQHLKSLDTRAVSLDTDLQRLNDIYNRKTMLLAATPGIMPVRGYPSDRYGWRVDPFSGRKDFHSGVDLSAPHGNKVVATADGFVTFSGRRFAYGNMVTIEHKFGISTRYGHMARLAVKSGQRVKKGDTIGYVGSTGRATGPHLHYEVRLNGQAVNPLAFLRHKEAD